MTKKTNNNALNIKVACCQIMNDYSKESVNSCLKNMQEKSEFKTAKKDTRRKQEGPKGPGSLTWGKGQRSQWSHLQRTSNVVHQILVEDI